jgi:lipopolysaccharide transport system ATP-binding protein
MAEIEFNRVTKTYQLGTRESLRESIMKSLTGLVKKDGRERKTFNALEDLSFEVNKGEVLGLIGSNGAGKTTILKLLSRVTYPTKGSIQVRGRLSSLIELGAGFHPDLSGAENIYLNASILGLKRDEIKAKYDDIVEFSGLEKFLDTPLKRYSSGMYARLAFSVAAHVDPDVLLVDEVLSVGDAIFQEKSLNKMKEFKTLGKSMVFVSHNMVAVQSICSRLIWLDHGKINAIGNPEEVISRYLHSQHYDEKDVVELDEGEEVYHYEVDGMSIDNICLLDRFGKPFETVSGGEPVSIEMHYHSNRKFTPVSIQVYLTDKQNYRLTSSILVGSLNNENVLSLQGEGEITCRFDATPVRPNPYYFNIDIYELDRLIFRQKGIGPLIVRPDQSASRWEDYNLFNVGNSWHVNGHSKNKI